MTRFENPNFDSKTLEIINLYEPLAAWFQKNAGTITYFDFNNAEYEFEKDDLNLHPDLQILSQMVQIALVWLKSKYEYTNEEKAIKAAVAISKIYELNQSDLSEDAKKALSISVNGISSEFSEDALTPPDLKDLEIEYLKNKKEELISELNKIDSRLSEIKEQQNVK